MDRNPPSREHYDVCVIGAGPAGLIAAGRAASTGSRVVVLEKNPTPGRKLLITGGGRCNITNAEFRHDVLTEKYGTKGKYLHSLFARFGPNEVVRFFAERGLDTRVEAENRVFPITDRAESVLDVLLAWARAGGVELRTGWPVTGLEYDTSAARVTGVRTPHGGVSAERWILACGGRSRPETGSTGEGFSWLRDLGHTVREPEPSLVPVRVREAWIRSLQGLSFQDARLSAEVTATPPQRVAERGKLLFTHFGLSGPLVLNMSGRIAALARDADEGAAVRLVIDLFPTVDHRTLERDLQAAFDAEPTRKVRNTLPRALPSRLIPLLLSHSDVNADKAAAAVTRDERRRIVRASKEIELTFDGLLGEDRAIVTSGGVSLDEVDFRTMASRLVTNLFIVGDMLDFERRSGGYSLQICWSSGWVAGAPYAPSERAAIGVK